MKKEPVVAVQLDQVLYRYQCGQGEGKSFCFSLGPISLDIYEDERVFIVGPSGSGKTTLLRLIAGLEQPNQGVIQIHSRVVSSIQEFVPPEKRKVGMLFQEHALFPHMTVEQNILFGLSSWSYQQQQDRLAQLEDLLDLKGYRSRYPHALSGGQQQRVALARTIAPKPSVVLLDEPLSSLDGELRSQLAEDLRDILKKEGITTIWVTHHQDEAFDLADRLVVLRNGHVEQIDSPARLYHHPQRRFVADFIGEAAFLPGELQGDMVATELGLYKCSDKAIEGKKTEIMVRPENVRAALAEDGPGTVSARKFQGFRYLYTITLSSGQKLFTYQPSTVTWSIGDTVKVMVDAKDIIVFKGKES